MSTDPKHCEKSLFGYQELVWYNIQTNKKMRRASGPRFLFLLVRLGLDKNSAHPPAFHPPPTTSWWWGGGGGSVDGMNEDRMHT